MFPGGTPSPGEETLPVAGQAAGSGSLSADVAMVPADTQDAWETGSVGAASVASVRTVGGTLLAAGTGSVPAIGPSAKNEKWIVENDCTDLMGDEDLTGRAEFQFRQALKEVEGAIAKQGKSAYLAAKLVLYKNHERKVSR